MPHKRAKRSVREKQRSAKGTDNEPGSQSKGALNSEAVPKSAARVLNAAKIQEEWRRKRKTEGDDRRPRKRQRTEAEAEGKGEGKVAMKIMPGESLAHFNRRVEESMRPLVREAVQISAAAARKVKKEEEMAKETQKAGRNAKPSRSVSPTPQSKKKVGKVAVIDEDDDNDAPASRSANPTQTGEANEKDRPKDFVAFSASAPRRLNDIAKAPPELKRLPRGAKASKAADTGVKGSTSLREGAMSMAQKAMLEEERERVIKAYRQLKKGAVGA